MASRTGSELILQDVAKLDRDAYLLTVSRMSIDNINDSTGQPQVLPMPAQQHQVPGPDHHAVGDVIWQSQTDITRQTSNFPKTVTTQTHAFSSMARRTPGRVATVAAGSPKLCYTVTTAPPMSPQQHLQHMQKTSLQICQEAAAGALAAACFIPGGQGSTVLPAELSTPFIDCKALRFAEAIQHGAKSLPAQLMSPLFPALEATNAAALQDTSTKLLQDIQGQGLREAVQRSMQQQQVQQRLQQQQALLRQQSMQKKQSLLRQHSMQKKQSQHTGWARPPGSSDAQVTTDSPTASPKKQHQACRTPRQSWPDGKRQCAETVNDEAGLNNLSSQCGGFSSPKPAGGSNNWSQSSISNDSGAGYCTPTHGHDTATSGYNTPTRRVSRFPATSPGCFNSFQAMRLMSGAVATEPFSPTAPFSPLMDMHTTQPSTQTPSRLRPQASCTLVYASPQHGPQGAQHTPIEFAGEPIYQGPSSSRRRREDTSPATQHVHVRLASPQKNMFTSGVEALMTPSARKAAAQEAFGDAVHALAVMQGAEPKLLNSISKQLAAAAVQTVVAELAAEAHAQAPHHNVPQGAWGTDGRPYRRFSTDGPTPIVPTPKSVYQEQYTLWATETPLRQNSWNAMAAWPGPAGIMHAGMQEGVGSAQQPVRTQGQHMQEELRRQAQLLQASSFGQPAQQLQGFQGLWSPAQQLQGSYVPYQYLQEAFGQQAQQVQDGYVPYQNLQEGFGQRAEQLQGDQGPAQQLQDGYVPYQNLQEAFGQQAQQLQGDQFPPQQVHDWGGATTFAAPAASGNNSWVVGAFGIAGPGCTYWTQHQQDMAAFAAGAPAMYHSMGPFVAGLQPTDNQCSLVASMPPEQQRTPGSFSTSKPGATLKTPGRQSDDATRSGRRTRSSYKQEMKAAAAALRKGICTPIQKSRPSSPHLDGVDYWTDKCNILCLSHHDSKGEAADGGLVQGGHEGPQWLSSCSSGDLELRPALAASDDDWQPMRRSSSMC